MLQNEIRKNSIMDNTVSIPVKNLLTKFFYKENYLYFQILLQTEENKLVVFKEFTDYSEYKKVFTELQKKISENVPVTISSENVLTFAGAAEAA